MLALKPSVRSAGRSAVVPRAQPVKAARNVVRRIQEAPVTKPALTVAVANLIMASPAGAAGKLFDFDLTLPIMAGQFLLLMVFLDKTWFTPLGKVLDDRDKLIRDKLADVKGNSEEIARMQEEAERILREARQAASAAVNEAKKTTEAEQNAKLEKLKAELEEKLAKAMAELDEEQKKAEGSIQEQVAALSKEIVERVLPDTPEPKTEEEAKAQMTKMMQQS